MFRAYSGKFRIYVIQCLWFKTVCFDNLCLFRIGQTMWPVRCLTNSFKGAWFYVWVYKAWCSRRSHFLAQYLCCNLNSYYHMYSYHLITKQVFPEKFSLYSTYPRFLISGFFQLGHYYKGLPLGNLIYVKPCYWFCIRTICKTAFNAKYVGF